MENKKVIIIVISTLFIGVAIFVILSFNSQGLASSEILNTVKSGDDYSLTDEALGIYKKRVEHEIKKSVDLYELKESYYALGVIENERKNYDSATTFLKIALEYSGSRQEKFKKLDVMTYSALSDVLIQKNQIEQSETYFKKAELTAKENHMEELLCEVYYRRAKSVLKAGYNLDEIVKLTEKSLKYAVKEERFIRNYLFLAKLYKLKGEFEKGLDYIQRALDKAIPINNNELINKCILGLAETYYLQGNYKNTIYIYEKLLETGRVVNSMNLLDVYGYLMDSYGSTRDYGKYKKYRDIYINNVTSLEVGLRNKELVWVYNKCIKIELDFKNLQKAKRYLVQAETLYSKAPREMYYNMDMYIRYNKNIIEYYETKDYERAMDGYKEILDELVKRGAVSDLKKRVTSDMIKIAYENNDYSTMTEYLNLETQWEDNSEANTDQLFIKVDNILNEIEVRKEKIKVIILCVLIIFMIFDRVKVMKKNNEIKELNLKLEELRKIDALTKVYNRGYLQEVSENLIKSKGDASFVMIDIDYFKLYNDNYGHVEGDRVLENVAKVIKDVFENHKVFRYGGEEFMVISSQGEEELIRSLDKLQLELRNLNIAHEYSSASNLVSLSIGATSKYINGEEDLKMAVKKADNNLYKAKENGRNQYVYES